MASSLTVWPELIAARYKHAIPPVYKSLLNSYNAHISSPAFEPTRPKVLPHLKTFDREGYISALPKPLPEEFKTWVLEWPAEAVIGWVWPGLDGKFDCRSGWRSNPNEEVRFWRSYGRNNLANFPPKPTTFKIELPKDDPLISMTASERAELGYGDLEWGVSDYDSSGNPHKEGGNWELLIQGLEIQEHGCAWSTFLLLNSAGKQWNGTVWYVEGEDLRYAMEAEDESDSRYGGGKLADGWVDWLRQEMEKIDGNYRRWQDERTHGSEPEKKQTSSLGRDQYW